MDLNRSLPRDVSRLQDFWNTNVTSFVEVANPRNSAILGGALALAVFLMVPARRSLEASARQLAIGQMPANRLRRSALAMWFLVTTVPGAVARRHHPLCRLHIGGLANRRCRTIRLDHGDDRLRRLLHHRVGPGRS